MQIVYRASLLDDPARPIIRFFAPDGSYADRIGAAPVAGAGIWIGRVPKGTVRAAISPTNHLGSFGFVVESIQTRSWLKLLEEGWRRRPGPVRSSVLARLIGWLPESDNSLAWATGATDFNAFRTWFDLRTRSVDAHDLERLRVQQDDLPRIRLVINSVGDMAALRRTLDSLRTQVFQHWEALVVGAKLPTADSRVLAMDQEGAVDWLGQPAGAVLTGVITSGDTLPAYALAFAAEQASRHANARILYGDEMFAGRPVFKPGWCPRLFAARSYLGRAIFAADLASWSSDERRSFVQSAALPERVGEWDEHAVRPLRRILLESGQQPTTEAGRPSPVFTATVPTAIIILTCNNPAMLARVVASIRAKSPPNTYRMIIVDNGDLDGPAGRLMAELDGAPDVLLIRRPGPFNFSRFCNEAAAACDEPLLIFLNDDTEVSSNDWLQRLAAQALEPDVGAVGAKLTFPDGRLQHVGVLVGMGGSAGHLGAMAPGDDPGWAGRNTVAHEVTAVTGACLAVTREKFEAVGGFDAEHLPVELSDIDLCLKLNARGWQTILDPAVHLMHEESASRGGATFRRLDVYVGQRELFIERWRHVLRDDPTFHPGLSLYSLQPALG